MADTKITALAAITTVDPAADVLPIVDISDTSMAASGTTKKITSNQILGSGGTATLASATITGDLTVDTNVLKVDTTNNRVSVNTTTFATDSVFAVKTTAGKFDVRAAGSLSVKLNSDQSMLYNVPTASSHVFQINDADAMTLNSTGLGIGVTPITSHILSAAGPLGITGTFAGTRTSYITNSSAASIYYTDGGGSGYFTDFGNLIIQPRTSAARSVVIATGSTTPVERAVVKSTGQVRFVPLASDPAGAEAGDVYYNSTSNKLKCYNGTTWNDLF